MAPILGRSPATAVHTVAQPQAATRLQAVLDLIEAHKGALVQIIGQSDIFPIDMDTLSMRQDSIPGSEG
ncbi:hypothetical protein B0G75_1535, partial [Paraburkholderia sp. BL18I3N2]